jgi:hypothetical protein
MATYTWNPPGPLPGNWGTNTNWTPNGIPTNLDTVLFNNTNNVECIVAANANAQTLDFGNYAGTLTINTNTVPIPTLTPFLLTVAGNLTLSTDLAFQLKPDANGRGTLVISANSTITSNGRTIDTTLRFSTINTTILLADTLTLGKGLTIQGTPSGNINLGSTVPGTQRALNLLNNGISDQDIDYAVVSDINGNAGLTIWNYSGTITNCNNWIIMTTQAVPISGFAIS